MSNTELSYFDEMYRDRDPWGYESSWYEQRKYALTLGSLARASYRRAFEPGCSIGVLTALLADRCDELVASDFHAGALDQARARLAGRSHVQLQHLEVPQHWPAGVFDLIVISELAYYLGDDDHTRLLDRVVGSLDPEGEVVLVHYRGETNYPSSGDEVHRRWRADPRLESIVHHVEPRFRLDVLRATAATNHPDP